MEGGKRAHNLSQFSIYPFLFCNFEIVLPNNRCLLFLRGWLSNKKLYVVILLLWDGGYNLLGGYTKFEFNRNYHFRLIKQQSFSDTSHNFIITTIYIEHIFKIRKQRKGAFIRKNVANKNKYAQGRGGAT